MSSLAIVRPLPFTLGGFSLTNPGALLTGDPKEAATKTAASGTAQGAVLDFGAPVTIDTFFAGYCDAAVGNPAATSLAVIYSSTSADPTDGTGVTLNLPLARSPYMGGYPRHFLLSTVDRTVRSVLVNPNGAPGRIGVFAAGAAWNPSKGHEYGSGRWVGDTGAVTRRSDGGFAVDEGVATTGWGWTMGDLTDTERDQLYFIAKDRRTTRNVLVIEDPAEVTNLHDGIHWGKFDRLEAYERDNPANNRWAFRIEDWAL